MSHVYQSIFIDFSNKFSDVELFQFQTVIHSCHIQDNNNNLHFDSHPLRVLLRALFVCMALFITVASDTSCYVTAIEPSFTSPARVIRI